MFDLIFGAPWWALLTIAVVGGAVAWSGNQRQDARTRNVGLGIIALAAVLFGLRFVFETDVAKVKRLNNELVQSVPHGDWSKMASLMDPDARLGTTEQTYFNSGKAIVDGAKADAERVGLKSVTVTGSEIKQDNSGITVSITVFSKQDATEAVGFGGTTSSWEMIWEKTGTEWRCHQITCLGIGPEKSAGVGRFLK